jgi:hypothetical protein
MIFDFSIVSIFDTPSAGGTPMAPSARRKMTLLDAILLVGSAAVGLALFELSHR